MLCFPSHPTPPKRKISDINRNVSSDTNKYPSFDFLRFDFALDYSPATLCLFFVFFIPCLWDKRKVKCILSLSQGFFFNNTD